MMTATTSRASTLPTLAWAVYAFVAVWVIATLVGLFAHEAGAVVGVSGAAAVLTYFGTTSGWPWLVERGLHLRTSTWGVLLLAFGSFVPARWGPSVAGLSLDDGPLIVGTALLIVDVVRREGVDGLRQPLALPLALFAAWNGVAVFLSGSFALAAFARGVGRWGLTAVAFAALLAICRRRHIVELVFGSVLVATLLQALFGLWSYAVDWLVLDPSIARNIGMELFRWYQPLYDVAPGRVTGMLGVSSNFYGAMMLFPIMLGAAWFLRTKDLAVRIAFLLAAVVAWAALVFSFTRASILAAVIGLLTIIVLGRAKWLVPVVIGLVVATYFFTPALGRFTDESHDRSALALTALDVIADNPISGLGPGEFVIELDDPEDRVALATPHNSFLLAAAETGVLGGLLLLAAAAWPGFFVIRRVTRREEPRLLLLGAAAAMLAYGAQTWSNNLFHIPSVSTYYWLIAAASVAWVYRFEADGEPVRL